MPTENGATDVNGAAARLSGLLQAERDAPTEEQQPEAQEVQDQEHEAIPEAEADNLETPEGDTEEETPKYKVKVDGEELEVTLEELQKGYMMEANYRNKTTALNKERETIESKAAEVDKQLEDARLLIEDQIAGLESPEMVELKEYDPEKYLKEFDKVQSKIKKFEALKAKRQEEHEARQAKLIQKEREALFDVFPEWKDQKVMAEQSGELFNIMKSIGYSDSELNQITDHRMFLMAHKAQQFDKIQKANLQAKTVKTKPKNSKPGTGTGKDDRVSADVKQMRERLKQSGSLRDAAALLRM